MLKVLSAGQIEDCGKSRGVLRLEVQKFRRRLRLLAGVKFVAHLHANATGKPGCVFNCSTSRFNLKGRLQALLYVNG